MPGPGQPTIFTEELADEICYRISCGETIAAICREEDKPSRMTIHRWMCSKPDFAAQLQHAIEIRADHWVDEILSISDDSKDDTIKVVIDEGELKIFPNTAKIQRDRLRVDTRKWAACKLYRRRYGDQQQIEHTGKEGGAILTETIDRTPRMTRDQWLINAAQDLKRPDIVAAADDDEQ